MTGGGSCSSSSSSSNTLLFAPFFQGHSGSEDGDFACVVENLDRERTFLGYFRTAPLAIHSGGEQVTISVVTTTSTTTSTTTTNVTTPSSLHDKPASVSEHCIASRPLVMHVHVTFQEEDNSSGSVLLNALFPAMVTDFSSLQTSLQLPSTALRHADLEQSLVEHIASAFPIHTVWLRGTTPDGAPLNLRVTDVLSQKLVWSEETATTTTTGADIIASLAAWSTQSLFSRHNSATLSLGVALDPAQVRTADATLHQGNEHDAVRALIDSATFDHVYIVPEPIQTEDALLKRACVPFDMAGVLLGIAGGSAADGSGTVSLTSSESFALAYRTAAGSTGRTWDMGSVLGGMPRGKSRLLPALVSSGSGGASAVLSAGGFSDDGGVDTVMQEVHNRYQTLRARHTLAESRALYLPVTSAVVPRETTEAQEEGGGDGGEEEAVWVRAWWHASLASVPNASAIPHQFESFAINYHHHHHHHHNTLTKNCGNGGTAAAMTTATDIASMFADIARQSQQCVCDTLGGGGLFDTPQCPIIWTTGADIAAGAPPSHVFCLVFDNSRGRSSNAAYAGARTLGLCAVALSVSDILAAAGGDAPTLQTLQPLIATALHETTDARSGGNASSSSLSVAVDAPPFGLAFVVSRSQQQSTTTTTTTTTILPPPVVLATTSAFPPSPSSQSSRWINVETNPVHTTATTRSPGNKGGGIHSLNARTRQHYLFVSDVPNLLHRCCYSARRVARRTAPPVTAAVSATTHFELATLSSSTSPTTHALPMYALEIVVTNPGTPEGAQALLAGPQRAAAAALAGHPVTIECVGQRFHAVVSTTTASSFMEGGEDVRTATRASLMTFLHVDDPQRLQQALAEAVSQQQQQQQQEVEVSVHSVALCPAQHQYAPLRHIHPTGENGFELVASSTTTTNAHPLLFLTQTSFGTPDDSGRSVPILAVLVPQYNPPASGGGGEEEEETMMSYTMVSTPSVVSRGNVTQTRGGQMPSRFAIRTRMGHTVTCSSLIVNISVAPVDD